MLFQDSLDLPVFEEGLPGVVGHINEFADAGREIWVFGTGDSSINKRARECQGKDCLTIGLNASVGIIPNLLYGFAIDLSALRYFKADVPQRDMVYLYPFCPQYLPLRAKVGQPLSISHRDRVYPKAFLDLVSGSRIRLSYFHYQPRGNPAGGSFYQSYSAKSSGFFSFNNARGQPCFVNGFARLSAERKEISALKMAQLLNASRPLPVTNYLNGIKAGRAVLPLAQLLSAARCERIQFAGFTCSSSDYQMTNLVVKNLLQLSGKIAHFYLPGCNRAHTVTGNGFKPVPRLFQVADVKSKRSKEYNILIPFFVKSDGTSNSETEKSSKGEALVQSAGSLDNEGRGSTTAGYQWLPMYSGFREQGNYYDWMRFAPEAAFSGSAPSDKIQLPPMALQRLDNLRHTLGSIQTLGLKSDHKLKVWLMEASFDGQSKIPRSILAQNQKTLCRHKVFKMAETAAFPKQFLFLIGLELLRQESGDGAIALLHDSDLPILDPQFLDRVDTALQEKHIIHNLCKGIYLTPRLHQVVTQMLDKGGTRFSDEMASDLRAELMSGACSNEVSRYLSVVWQHFNSALKESQAAGKDINHLSAGLQEHLVMSRLSDLDGSAVRYMRQIKQQYDDARGMNYYFPGFSWSGKVLDVIKTLSISAIYTGWGFEDSTFMETAKRLWCSPDEKSAGVGCVTGPSGRLDAQGQVLGDAIHLYHTPSLPLPRQSADMSREALYEAIFAFELKKTIQIDFVENKSIAAATVAQTGDTVLSEICYPLVHQALTESVVPDIATSRLFRTIFDYACPGETGSVDPAKLMRYYDYWIMRNEGWRIFELPGCCGETEGGLYQNDPHFRNWALQNHIRLSDIRLNIRLKEILDV